MQHTESYERFVYHAASEVVRARKLRRERKREEKRRAAEAEEERRKIGGTGGAVADETNNPMSSPPSTPRQKLMEMDAEDSSRINGYQRGYTSNDRQHKSRS